MKLIFRITLYLLLLHCTACEDVIEVDLPTAEPRLVVEASLLWKKETSGNFQVIRLSLSTDFYSNIIPPVSDAMVQVINSTGNIFSFMHQDEENEGLYICNNFLPEIGETYTIHIVYNDNVYEGTETLYEVPELVDVTESTEGFLDDQIVIKAFFNDPVDEDNYYMHRFRREEHGPEYAVFDDEFVNGNYTYTVRIYDDLESGETMLIDLIGISQRYYNYMEKLFITTSEGNIGPFRVAPSALRGNIINITNPDKNPYGYFALAEVSTIAYTVQ